MLALARAAAERGEHSVAVITAQVAAEFAIERALIALIEAAFGSEYVEELVALLPDRTLMNPRGRRLWKAITHDQLSQAAAWKE
jgi:HEPN domain-containing protein